MGLTDDRAWGDICENYATFLTEHGDYERAHAMFERSYRSLTAVHAPGDLPLARHVWNSARLDMATMHFDSAAAKLDRAVDWFAAMGAGFQSYQAGALGFRGMVEVDRGKWQAARPFFEHSYDIRRAALPAGPSRGRDRAPRRGVVSVRRRRHGRHTRRMVLEGERAVQANVRLSAEALSEREALSCLSTRPNTYDQMISILEHGQGLHRVPEVWDRVMRARGTVFEAIASRERWLHGEGDSTLAAWAEARGSGALAGGTRGRRRIARGHRGRAAAQGIDRARHRRAGRRRGATGGRDSARLRGGRPRARRA